MDCYDNSDALVVYDAGTPREFDGAKAVRGDFQNFLDNNKNFKVEFISLHVVSDGKMGLANSIQRFTGSDKSGKPVDTTFRITTFGASRMGSGRSSICMFPTRSTWQLVRLTCSPSSNF